MPTLNWIGKEKVVNFAAKVPVHALKRLYTHGNPSGNKIIHGDNLTALKSLIPLYEGKIKCIYIDPPYNTGNENWVYNDNVNSPQIQKWLGQVVGREGEDLTRHDKWLCMMYPRLKLLKQLLSDDGAIFISIDDNEVANLKLICDEIFGIRNFVAQLVWEKKKKGAFLSKTVTNIKEYILVYCKSTNSFGGLIGAINRDTETYPCIKTTNPRGIRIIPKGTPSKYKEKSYKIEANTRISAGNMELIYLDTAIIEDGILQFDVRVDSNWIYQQSSIDEFATKRLLYLTQDHYIRRIVNEQRIKMLKDLLLRVGADGRSEKTFTYDENLNNGGWGTNEDANEELHKILGKQYAFDFAKPSRLIGKLIQTISDKNSLVLDAFAGSGTTAHAVINLNAADGGNRHFILIEMEPYAETITAERVRRVGGNFDYYELGEPLFVEGDINPDVDIEDIRGYVWAMETSTPYEKPNAEDCAAFLGVYEGTAFYFYEGILDRDFLGTMRTRADSYIIFAESCAVDEEFLRKYKIEFKKIPRDISKIWIDAEQ